MMNKTLFLLTCSVPLWLGCGDEQANTDAAVVDANPVDANPVDATSLDASCLGQGRVTVSYGGNDLPAEISGFYDEIFDCGPSGDLDAGVDLSRCFRKNDGLTWRIQNTGCGWDIGRVEDQLPPFPPSFRRYARTYSGQCSLIPAEQLTPVVLTRELYFDGSGDLIPGLSSVYERGGPH